jgi:hypothetical protein
MLSRFIVPAERLEELAPYAGGPFRADRAWELSVLAGGIGDEPLRGLLERQLGLVEACLRRHAPALRVPVLELRLPSGETESVMQVSRAVAQRLGAQVAAFVEIPSDDAWPAAEVVSALAAAAEETGSVRGYKLRCGGATPEAFPPVERVARSLALCRDHGVPFKATAGLHHPLRQFRAREDVVMHGFLNVFGAGVLAAARGLDESVLRQVVGEERFEAFSFDEGGFAWREHSATADEIRAARARLVTSFGSCSFDEPREDLVELGLL